MTESYTVYALKSLFDGRIYVGFTSDMEKRLKEHNAGKTKSTKGFRPWILIYTEIAETRQKAREKEKYLKSGIGKEFLKSLEL
ncbi:GIY-YIG nuclease family protein [Cyclobacterium plantarum]|uniref:GIY-YIG nuclease family protein n=2 Tax=Cyclobacterium plantarum TaxID=2716263 RepID=A0ABX0HAG4_9BACT|nr:GIY-YIG nuclease family protein [Cyclobacterium plantarum]NHE56975.1 GIY-YIG nuclease family protein [Cyclobacterium plantarum]